MGRVCNNCNCENYDQCSIVGYMPIGFCCSKCVLYDEEHTCLSTKTKRVSEKSVRLKEGELKPISTSIENGLLRVVIKKNDKEIPVYIDLQKHLE
jgi:hypothetical protein